MGVGERGGVGVCGATLLPIRALDQAFTPQSPPSGEAGTVSRESGYMSSFGARVHGSCERPQRRGSGSPALQRAAPPCPELRRSRQPA